MEKFRKTGISRIAYQRYGYLAQDTHRRKGYDGRKGVFH
jgi:hypothetical protein